jgi:hypothetical protein
MGEYFSSLFRAVCLTFPLQSFSVCEVCGAGGLRLFSTKAKLRILYHKYFLGKRCGTHKDCWF